MLNPMRFRAEVLGPEGQGDLVSRLTNPVSQIIALVLAVNNLLTKSPLTLPPECLNNNCKLPKAQHDNHPKK